MKIALYAAVASVLLLSGCNSLHKAALANDANEVRRLLDKGADVNSRKLSGETPLNIAAGFSSFEIAKMLVDKGADLNNVTKGDDTPLMLAIRTGHLKTAKLLIEKGADVNLGENSGSQYTPLMYAILRGYPEMVKFLIEHDVSLSPRNAQGETALDVAKRLGASQGAPDSFKTIIAMLQPNFAAPDKIIAPTPIAGNSGKYMSPFTAAGAVALWAQPQTAAQGGQSGIGSQVGGAVGQQVGDRLLGFVPFGLGGMVGREAGKSAASTPSESRARIPTAEEAKASSDVSFKSADDLAVYLYAKYSTHPDYARILSLTRKVYPELATVYTSAIERASHTSDKAPPMEVASNDAKKGISSRDKLKELQQLKQDGLISESDYQAKKTEILKSF